MKKNLSISKLDVAEFARLGHELSGQLCLNEMSRLAELCVSPLPDLFTMQTPLVKWSAQGELREQRTGEPQIWMHVHIQAQVPLRCQRCLQSVTQSLHLELTYRFVSTEQEALQEDGESEEDVLVVTRSLDLPALCEDELILALPLVALHQVCPDPLVEGLDQAGLALEVSDDADDEIAQSVKTQDNKEDKKENPFAVLEGLRGKLH